MTQQEYNNLQKIEDQLKSVKNSMETISNDLQNVKFSMEKDDEINNNTNAGNQTFIFLKIIMESLPFPVYIKDEEGKYLIINKLEASLFDLKESEIIGKHDKDFVNDDAELKVIIKTDLEVLYENKSIELPTQKFSLPNGKSYIFKTHKIPVLNPITGKPNIFGFSIDVTDTVNLNKLKEIVVMCNNPYL